MDTFIEFLVVIGYCLIRLASNTKELGLTIVVAFCLAGIFWALCNYWAKLWNLNYRMKFIHHVFCAIAAFFTLVFTLSFVSLKYTEEIATTLIKEWQQEIQADQRWKSDTFKKTYEAVKALGIEDFSQYPHPDQGGRLMPSSQPKSRETTALIYADESVKHFQNHHPYLSEILWAKTEIPKQLILNDNVHFFETHANGTYDLSDAVTLAANNITEGLNEQTPQVVKISRIAIVILFLIIQAIPLTLIGLGAYKDLKEIT